MKREEISFTLLSTNETKNGYIYLTTATILFPYSPFSISGQSCASRKSHSTLSVVPIVSSALAAMACGYMWEGRKSTT